MQHLLISSSRRVLSFALPCADALTSLLHLVSINVSYSKHLRAVKRYLFYQYRIFIQTNTPLEHCSSFIYFSTTCFGHRQVEKVLNRKSVLLCTIKVIKYIQQLLFPVYFIVLRFWWGNLRERDHWGDKDVDGRIILRWIFRKWEGVDSG